MDSFDKKTLKKHGSSFFVGKKHEKMVHERCFGEKKDVDIFWGTKL